MTTWTNGQKKTKNEKNTNVYKTQFKKVQYWIIRTTPKTGSISWFNWLIIRSLSRRGTCCVLTNPLMSLIRYNTVYRTRRNKDWITVTTIGTSRLSSMEHIFHNGLPTLDGIYEILEGIIWTSSFKNLFLKVLSKCQLSFKVIMMRTANSGISYHFGVIYSTLLLWLRCII